MSQNGSWMRQSTRRPALLAGPFGRQGLATTSGAPERWTRNAPCPQSPTNHVGVGSIEQTEVILQLCPPPVRRIMSVSEASNTASSFHRVLWWSGNGDCKCDTASRRGGLPFPVSDHGSSCGSDRIKFPFGGGKGVRKSARYGCLVYLLGRPRGRNVDSSPSRAAIRFCQRSVPYG